MKKKALAIISVIAVYLGFLAAAIVLGSQQGLYFQDNFWCYAGDGFLKAPGGDWIRRSGYDCFELHFSDQTITAQQSVLPDGGVRIDFSDGWAVEHSADASWRVFGDYAWASDAVLILTDMAEQDFRFAAAAVEERSPIYDQNGSVIGETVQLFSAEGEFLDAYEKLLSADGEFLDSYEIWPGQPQFSTPEKTAVILEDGAVIPDGDVIFMNAEGEYLLDSHQLGRIDASLPGGYSSADRRSIASFLLRIGNGELERRHEAMDMQIFLSVLLYGAGALQLFLPQELAFFGSRWRFKNEPELSDSGRAAMLIGGGVVMLIAIIMLFIGF